jgi:hypothetical protein
MLLTKARLEFPFSRTVTAGAPRPAGAVEPRILKFSRTTGFTPVTLAAGTPPGGATISEVKPASGCSETTQPP